MKKKFYVHDHAEHGYRHTLRQARTGAAVTEEERIELGNLLDSGLKKGHVEDNHENLRKIFPKGQSINQFSQERLNTAVSHLNSFARASLNDVPAILLFEQIYGSSVLKKLGVKLISSSEICLTPKNIVRLNASNFCPVAFTLTNLRLLCQVTFLFFFGTGFP